MLEGRWAPGHLNELTEPECWELLRSHQVGRVGYCDGSGSVMLPVNYAVHDGAILFRTTPRGSLARHLRAGYASFEVDEIDDYTQSGWSVLVRGQARAMEPEDLPPDASDRPVPWASGERPLVVRITASTVTGRRLMPS